MNNYLLTAFKDINYSIQKYMKCAIIECDQQVSGNFKACSANHGSYLNTILSNLQNSFSGINADSRGSRTVEEAIHYAQYAR